MAKKKTKKRTAKRVIKKGKPHHVVGGPPTNDFASVYIVCKEREQALKIAQTLVSERLVACFNIYENITSIYFWQGELEKNTEVALIGKTRLELADDIKERVRGLHSYDIPCVVFWPIIDGAQSFLEWISENTK